METRKKPAGRSNRKTTRTALPGSIYLNKNRYWWKIQLPGEAKAKARPLRSFGSKFATTDYGVAVEVASNIWQTAIYSQNDEANIEIVNIASLVVAYLQHVDEYYRNDNNKQTSEVKHIRYSLKPLVDVFGCLSLEEFGPLKLIELREHMIALDWSRGVINQRVGRIKRIFKWGVCRQAVSPMIYHGLMAVEGLKRGRTSARETPKRRPVDERDVYAILPYTTPVIAAMIKLQLLTGMRPGELVIMRPCDIDRNGEVWHYCPDKHKTQYLGSERIVSIGLRGQEILRPYMLRSEEVYLFSPADSEKQRLKKMHAERKVPLKYGNRPGTNRKGLSNFSDCYTSANYGQAVRHAIKAANKVIKSKHAATGTLDDFREIRWTPYQLRHTAATKVRKEFGYESAGAALGHTNMSATAIYAERNQGLADEAARRLG